MLRRLCRYSVKVTIQSPHVLDLVFSALLWCRRYRAFLSVNIVGLLVMIIIMKEIEHFTICKVSLLVEYASADAMEP